MTAREHAEALWSKMKYEMMISGGTDKDAVFPVLESHIQAAMDEAKSEAIAVGPAPTTSKLPGNL